MIRKVRIFGYRLFKDFTFEPNRRLNILVGENESGKSTLLEAIGLALTGRVNGRPAAEELNPYWFNHDLVADFFKARRSGKPVSPPEILIEIFLEDRDEFQRLLFGAHHSDPATRACAGVSFRVVPDPDYSAELEAHLRSDSSIIPVEYYRIDWRSFGDIELSKRPKELSVATIDSRTVRSTSGVDYHTRQMLHEHLGAERKAEVSLAYRVIKEKMTNEHLRAVNAEMATLEGTLNGSPLSLAMDQSARSSWDASVVPHVANIPFSMSGQGQQAAVKIALAMGRRASAAKVVTLEEPENHLSHTSLNQLLRRIQMLAGESQQLFITTHSSFVLNRLGLDGIVFLTNGRVASLLDLPADTVAYFKKLPGHDTLRMVLADRLVLVEGPSDEILFERFFRDATGRRPIEAGIDVISMRGLSLKHCLRLVRALKKHSATLRDNDGKSRAELVADLDDLISDERQIFTGELADGTTLEPQLIAANGEGVLRRILGLSEGTDLERWMTNNKTEAALRIAESSETVTAPGYFQDAIKFIHVQR